MYSLLFVSIFVALALGVAGLFLPAQSGVSKAYVKQAIGNAVQVSSSAAIDAAKASIQSSGSSQGLTVLGYKDAQAVVIGKDTDVTIQVEFSNGTAAPTWVSLEVVLTQTAYQTQTIKQVSNG